MVKYLVEYVWSDKGMCNREVQRVSGSVRDKTRLVERNAVSEAQLECKQHRI